MGKPKKSRLGKSDNGSTRLISLCERCSFLKSIPDGSTETIADLAPHMHKCYNDLGQTLTTEQLNSQDVNTNWDLFS